MTTIAAFATGFGIGTVLFPLSFWFWLLFLIDCIWLSWLVSDDGSGSDYYQPSTGGATALTLCTAVFLQYFTSIKVFSWIVANPGLFALGFGFYILMGIAWSFIKWTTLLVDWRDNCQNNLRQTEKIIVGYQADLQKADIKEVEKIEITKRIYAAKEDLKSKLPTANKNKSRIIAWTAYWPWSLLWTFVTDYVRRFFQRIFQMLESQYDAIQKRILKDFYKD